MSITELSKMESIEAMFVQVAHGLTTSNGTVTLHGTSPSTVFFADRPQRVVGHIHTDKFISQWGEGENSFEEDPPNAVISFTPSQADVPEEAIVVLRNPKIEAGELTYNIQVLDGTLPKESGPCSLFIDPIGRPLSPMSVAGVRRRERRRDLRR